MRVAVVAERTARHADTDAARRLSALAGRLDDRGHPVSVFCAQWWDGDPDRFEADGLTYRAVIPDDGTPDRRFLTRLPGLVRPFDPDVVHAAHASPAVVHAARLAATLLRVPLVVDWYDARPLSGWPERARRLAARVPDRVVTPSRLVRTQVRELGRPAEAVEVIPDGIDMDRVRAVEAEDAADIVYSRRLDADANLESLLLALAELRTMDWRAAVVGEGPERERYERQARDLRIDDRLDFLGEVTDERKVAILKGADAYVHTARRSPFATDLLLALAAGCVGIAEYHAGSSAHELVERRDRGVRVTTEDELVDAIRAAAEREPREVDEDYAAFDHGRIAECYLECYEGAVGDRGLF